MEFNKKNNITRNEFNTRAIYELERILSQTIYGSNEVSNQIGYGTEYFASYGPGKNIKLH